MEKDCITYPMKMKNYATIIVLSLVLLLPTLPSLAQQNNGLASVSPEDLKTALGDWTGSLTYIDYQSNEPYTMPANLQVKPGKNESELVLHNIYPNEPKANGKGKFKITAGGQKLNNEAVTAKEILSDGVKIVTEYQGKDNNQKALIRNTYVLRSSSLIIRKEVRFGDSSQWLKRNEFAYTR